MSSARTPIIPATAGPHSRGSYSGRHTLSTCHSRSRRNISSSSLQSSTRIGVGCMRWCIILMLSSAQLYASLTFYLPHCLHAALWCLSLSLWPAAVGLGLARIYLIAPTCIQCILACAHTSQRSACACVRVRVRAWVRACVRVFAGAGAEADTDVGRNTVGLPRGCEQAPPVLVSAIVANYSAACARASSSGCYVWFHACHTLCVGVAAERW